MIINDENVRLAFEGFKTLYTDAFSNAPSHVDQVATRVMSGNRDETYGWLSSFPQIRKWVGSRHINQLSAHKFKIENELFESTIAVKRNDIEDDRIGIYAAMFSEVGWLARQHPDEMIFNVLADGLTGVAYDGNPFFSDQHSYEDADGEAVQVSNMAMSGSGPVWYLLDTSRQIRPLVWQVREDYTFEQSTDPSDDYVFRQNDYLFGVRARVNAGYGLWQLAYASNEPLNEQTYEAARAAMHAMRGDGGRVLGVMPNTLVVPPTLEGAALRVVNTEYGGAGASNPWKGTAEAIVTPYLPDEAA